MKTSVCIPTYNRPDLLNEAIQSCIKQTYPPYEIIVSDDSKGEESQKLVNEIKSNNKTDIHIIYIKNTPSLGQLGNVNELIKKASGDKFVLLHDDDLLTPDALKWMKECFDKFPSVEVVYGKQVLISEDGAEMPEDSETLNKYFFRTNQFEGSVLSSIEAAMVQQFPNDGYMINTDIVKKLKYGSKEIVGNAGDFDFGFRLGQAGYVFYYLPRVTAKYRITQSSVARNGTDSGYQSYKLISKLEYSPSGKVNYQNIILQKKAPIAIFQALNSGNRKDALDIYFSKWHRGKILTPGGIKRIIKIAASYFN